MELNRRSKIKRDYNRYQLTYPFRGNKIYETRSLTKAIKKGYRDFKLLNDINEGIFTITNLDKRIDYKCKVKDNKLLKIDKHSNLDALPKL